MIKSHVGDVLSALAAAKAEALEDMGEMAVSYAKDKCPVRTGRLQNSITYKVSDGRVVVGTDVEYGASVELGTRKQQAQPFLVPALTEHMAAYHKAENDVMKGSRW